MRPLRNLVHVERMPDLGCSRTEDGLMVTSGGIILPQTFEAKGPAAKLNAVRDVFRARVLAVGPRVPELRPGDEILCFSWSAKADGTPRSLYTGVDVGEGELLVAYPDDIVCAVDVAAPITLREGTEPDPFPTGSPYRRSA